MNGHDTNVPAPGLSERGKNGRVHNLGEMIDRSLPPEPAMIIEIAPDGTESTITFGEFHRTADAVGAALLQKGLRRGDAVGILAANSARYLVAFLGIMRAGLVAVPINIKLPAQTIVRLVADASLRHAFVDAERATLLRDNGCDHALTLSRLDDNAVWAALGKTDSAAFAPCEMADHEHALVLYTSGSSGLPKGVPLTHGGYVWATDALAASGPPLKGKRALIAAPLFHMNGLLQSCLTAMVGGTVVLLCRFTPRDYLEAIAKYRCQVVTSVPTMLALVVREPDTWKRLDLSCVEIITTGSAPSTESLFDRVAEVFPKARILNGWGTTESSPVAFGPHPQGIPRPKLSIGYPMPQAELKFVDGAGPDEGVLWIRSRAVMPGYLNRPEATADRLRDGWYNTGDVMRRDAQGFYYFVGRADDMFVCGGENIYPGEVEKILETHPSVLQAAVVPVPDEIKGQLPVAFVVLRAGAKVDPDALKRHVLERAPAYQHPRYVEFVAELPLAGTNKVDRAALITMAHDRFQRQA